MDLHEQLALKQEVESTQVDKSKLWELQDLHLALVGGGIGETIL